MAGFGSLVHLFTGTAPNRPAVTDGFKFTDAYLRNLYSFPLNEVNTLKRVCSTQPTDQPIDQPIVVTAQSMSVDVVTNELKISAPVNEVCNNDGTQVDRSAQALHLQASTISDSTESCLEDQQVPDSRVSEPFRKPSSDARGCSKNKNRRSGKRKNDDGGQYVDRQKLEDPEEREKRRVVRLLQIQQAKSVIEAGNMDCLVVATKFYPTPIVLSLIDFVAPSRPIIVFSPYKEPLLDCFLKLKEHGGVLMIKLSETWLRGYQVLPDRTHPSINMSGSGGYLLTAMTVENDEKRAD
jgi:tRNA (adenine-N(1)-)-methyltransferase non-catalytic subunit